MHDVHLVFVQYPKLQDLLSQCNSGIQTPGGFAFPNRRRLYYLYSSVQERVWEVLEMAFNEKQLQSRRTGKMGEICFFHFVQNQINLRISQINALIHMNVDQQGYHLLASWYFL